jgi:hypothetical protein
LYGEFTVLPLFTFLRFVFCVETNKRVSHCRSVRIRRLIMKRVSFTISSIFLHRGAFDCVVVSCRSVIVWRALDNRTTVST